VHIIIWLTFNSAFKNIDEQQQQKMPHIHAHLSQPKIACQTVLELLLLKLHPWLKTNKKDEIQFPVPYASCTVSDRRLACSFTLKMEAHHYNISLESQL
jgi:hypothetical protein